MQIVLMRHGKPKIEHGLRLNAAEFGVWTEKYNTVGVDAKSRPPQAAIHQATRCAFTVCSNLERSKESARLLGIEHIGICSPMFREMDIPHATWRVPNLSPQAWLVVFRLAWALGYSANAESFNSAKKRARDCAEQLADLASTHGTVLFVGHGSLNWFVARHLKSLGWKSSGHPPRSYWEYCVLSCSPTAV